MAWEPVSDDGSSKVTHYIVEKRETSRVVWSTVSDCMEERTVSVQKLVRGNEYVFRVRGVNKFGPGEPLESEPVIAKNPFGMILFYYYYYYYCDFQFIIDTGHKQFNK